MIRPKLLRQSRRSPRFVKWLMQCKAATVPWHSGPARRLSNNSRLSNLAATNALFNNEVLGKRNFAALADVYTVDACILPPGAPMISGREAITKFWSDLVQAANATSAVLASDDVMTAGDGVVEIGHATLTVEPPDQAPARMEVKYVVYWRQEQGLWKWQVDIWNTNA
jgi:ketosteroid isomerase-like protein